MRRPKILIIRLSSIGDIILTSPFIRQTRIAFPEAQIDYIVKKQFSELLIFNPHIDNVCSLGTSKKNEKMTELRKKIKKQKYDLIFDLHNNFRSNWLTNGLSKRKIKKDKFNRALLVYTGLNRYRQVTPIPLRYLQTGKKAGIKDDGNGLDLFWPNRYEQLADRIIAQIKTSAGFFALAPGAAHFSKRWPIERFRELIEHILSKTQSAIIILGSKKEQAELGSLVIDPKVMNLAGKLSLLESATILNRARGLVTNDSGLMHMASAVQTPLVALFGSTVKELGFFPFRCKHVVLEKADLNCRPCSHIGRKDCPKKHFKCMLDLSTEMVFDALQNLVKN